MNNSVIDTIYLSKLIYRNERRHNLDIICERLNIKKDIQRHSAEGDVIITTEDVEDEKYIKYIIIQRKIFEYNLMICIL
ncbi:MAG: hypothetical protein H7A31_01685 [Thermotogae bacterium]|nr:hypothetical protein [Thermotogota bacterium]